MNTNKIELVERAIIASLEYIENHQSENGSWVDWQLPPGQSDGWTTAYVGYKLRHVPTNLRHISKSTIQAASDWILRNENSDGGWGYNKKVGSDADSTAYAILFLRSEERPVPVRSYRFLKEFQCSDGGFSTYKASEGNDSWRISHPDVSPIALIALGTKYSRKTSWIKRGINYVIKQRTSNGMWNSFWWDSNIYSVEANLSFLNTVKVQFDANGMIEILRRAKHKKAFEVALLISCILHTEDKFREAKISNLVDQLILEQRSDGSWTSEPILRVTKQNCFEPWNSGDPGSLYSDPNRLFTSSTVLESLCKVYKLLRAPREMSTIPYTRPIHEAVFLLRVRIIQ